MLVGTSVARFRACLRQFGPILGPKMGFRSYPMRRFFENAELVKIELPLWREPNSEGAHPSKNAPGSDPGSSPVTACASGKIREPPASRENTGKLIRGEENCQYFCSHLWVCRTWIFGAAPARLHPALSCLVGKRLRCGRVMPQKYIVVPV